MDWPQPKPKSPPQWPKIDPKVGERDEKGLTTNFLLGLLSFNMTDFHKSAMHCSPFPVPPQHTHTKKSWNSVDFSAIYIGLHYLLTNWLRFITNWHFLVHATTQYMTYKYVKPGRCMFLRFKSCRKCQLITEHQRQKKHPLKAYYRWNMCFCSICTQTTTFSQTHISLSMVWDEVT